LYAPKCTYFPSARCRELVIKPPELILTPSMIAERCLRRWLETLLGISKNELGGVAMSWHGLPTVNQTQRASAAPATGSGLVVDVRTSRDRGREFSAEATHTLMRSKFRWSAPHRRTPIALQTKTAHWFSRDCSHNEPYPLRLSRRCYRRDLIRTEALRLIERTDSEKIWCVWFETGDSGRWSLDGLAFSVRA
jgi:hypothetical protein